MDSFKLARHILQQEITIFQSHDLDILLPSAKESREKEIKRDLIIRYFFQGKNFEKHFGKIVVAKLASKSILSNIQNRTFFG